MFTKTPTGLRMHVNIKTTKDIADVYTARIYINGNCKHAETCINANGAIKFCVEWLKEELRNK